MSKHVANPKLWEQVKAKARSELGGHSARAMQRAVQLYKAAGGKYTGRKTGKSSLELWTNQEWEYSGKGETGVYLPKRKVAALRGTEAGRKKLAQAARKKRAATKAGKKSARHGLAAGTSKKRK